MVFGGVEDEHLQLNEDTLWSGEPPADLHSIDIRKDFDHVMGLLRTGRNAEADTFITLPGETAEAGGSGGLKSHETAGNLAVP